MPATATSPNPQATKPPSNKAIGTWSGGRYLHFGEAIEPERLEALLRPGKGVDTVLTADTYGQGEADLVLGRALAGVPSEEYSLVGAMIVSFSGRSSSSPEGSRSTITVEPEAISPCFSTSSASGSSM